MAAYAIDAARRVIGQLHAVYPHMSTTARAQMIGLTPEPLRIV